MREARRPPSSPEIGSVERVVAMRSFPGADELHAGELSVLASIARPRRLERGEALTQQGHVVRAIFVVLEGEMLVRREGRAPERAGVGSAIGVLEALSHDARGLECEAASSAIVLSIAIDDLDDVFEELPIVLVRVMGHVARRALALGLVRGARGESARAVRVPSRPLDLVERILALRACAALSGATIDAIAALANVARELRLSAGEPLWRTGEPAASLFVVVSGEAEITSTGDRGTTLRAGELAGAPEILAGVPHPTDAIAREPLVALAIDRDELLDTWEDHTDLGIELLQEVSAAVLAADAIA